MTVTLDYDTDRGKVRLLIADIDSDAAVFQDDAIDAFLALALDGNVKRAAAQALLTIAVNETLVQKRIKLLDLSTDGVSEANALRALAADLMGQAENEEVEGAFDWAEMVSSGWQQEERLYKEQLRSGL